MCGVPPVVIAIQNCEEVQTYQSVNAFFGNKKNAIFAHRAPERPQSNLYLKTFMFCKYKGFQGEENTHFCDSWDLAEFLHAL